MATETDLLLDGTAELLLAVDLLAVEMKRKLLCNRHKAALGACSWQYLADRLGEEVTELWEAQGRWARGEAPTTAILSEAGDTANFALFCAVKAQREVPPNLR